jgi:aminoglycoside phosphotransferase (APT) family kinase protein
MRGAWAAAVHAIDVRDASAERHRLVLRRFVRVEDLVKEPDLPEREARVLELLAGSAVPAPPLVAADVRGEQCDVPAILMARMPGYVDLAPRDLERWLHALASALPAIHAISVEGATITRYTPYYDVKNQPPPAWTHEPDAWAVMSARLRAPAPKAPARFIHRDYHPGNILWSRGRITAVLDWVNACVGPPGVDVAHLRTNLAVLHGVEVADRFRALYEGLAEAGRHDPYWDAVSMLDTNFAVEAQADDAPDAWTDQGRTDLTQALRRERLDGYAISLARQL